MSNTIAIEPWFAAVDVSHVDKVCKRRILRSAITIDDQHMFGCDGDGNRVMKRSRCGIGTPIDRIDADARSGDDRLDEPHVLDGVVTYSDMRVGLALRRTDMRA